MFLLRSVMSTFDVMYACLISVLVQLANDLIYVVFSPILDGASLVQRPFIFRAFT